MPGTNRAQSVNGFTIFAQDVRRKLMRERGGNCQISWDELKEVASIQWTSLPTEEQAVFKQRAKEQRLKDRLERRSRAPKVSEELNIVRDEISLLQDFPRKREMDIVRLHQAWDWDCSDRTRHQDKRFVVVSCQTYCQESTSASEETRYFPAEVALVEFSLSGGIHAQCHDILPLLEPLRSEEQRQDLTDRTHNVHGICPSQVPKTHSLRKIYDFAREIFHRRGRLFCFQNEWLSVLGALQYISLKHGGDLLIPHPANQLICIEDLLKAMVDWHDLSGRMDLSLAHDMHQAVVDTHDSWRAQLCDLHAQQLIQGQVKNVKRMKYKCSLSLAKGAAALIRKWMDEERIMVGRSQNYPVKIEPPPRQLTPPTEDENRNKTDRLQGWLRKADSDDSDDVVVLSAETQESERQTPDFVSLVVAAEEERQMVADTIKEKEREKAERRAERRRRKEALKQNTKEEEPTPLINGFQPTESVPTTGMVTSSDMDSFNPLAWGDSRVESVPKTSSPVRIDMNIDDFLNIFPPVPSNNLPSVPVVPFESPAEIEMKTPEPMENDNTLKAESSDEEQMDTPRRLIGFGRGVLLQNGHWVSPSSLPVGKFGRGFVITRPNAQ